MTDTNVKKRKCVNCGDEIPEKDGVVLLRGASFACKNCHKAQDHERKEKQEVCEFC